MLLVDSTPEEVFEGIEWPSEVVKDELVKNIKRRLTPQAIRLRADLEVTCFTYQGIEAIKEGLREGLKCSTEEFPIKVKLDATPVYVITTNALDKAQGVEALEKAIAAIQAKMKELGGSCTVKTEVRRTTSCVCVSVSFRVLITLVLSTNSHLLSTSVTRQPHRSLAIPRRTRTTTNERMLRDTTAVYVQHNNKNNNNNTNTSNTTSSRYSYNSPSLLACLLAWCTRPRPHAQVLPLVLRFPTQPRPTNVSVLTTKNSPTSLGQKLSGNGGSERYTAVGAPISLMQLLMQLRKARTRVSSRLASANEKSTSRSYV